MKENNAYRTIIKTDPLNPSDSENFVSADNHGATVVFHGITRDHTGARKVLYLEYEAYLPMAKRKLEEVAREMCQNWDVRVSIQHRLGRVDIGEASLVVAVGSPHREAAYNAAEFSVDRIKQIVPIWKKEYFEGGDIWIGDSDGFRPMEDAQVS